MHEASLYEHNSFVTLTYNDDHSPLDGGLHHVDFQKFMKRLRSRFPSAPIRFYMCGEYGSSLNRPHFHTILFNHTFTDLSLWQISGSGSHLFRSATLESLWPFGFSSIGSVTFASAAYIARYVMAKKSGFQAVRSYDSVNTETGEVFMRRPEYNAMSLKPGIGAGWFDKYTSDVFPHDRVVYDGVESKPPRYYDKRYSRFSPDSFDAIKDKRIFDNSAQWADNTPDRLAAKEAVCKATLSKFKRSL